MPYPTGNTPQTDSATVTLTVPVVVDGEANDFLLDALTAFLVSLTSPKAWDCQNYSVSCVDAAADAQTMLDSMTIAW